MEFIKIYWPLLLCIFVPCVALFVYADIESKQWYKYKIEHNCKRTEKVKTEFIIIGSTPMFIGEYEYKCDGNEIIWR